MLGLAVTLLEMRGRVAAHRARRMLRGKRPGPSSRIDGNETMTRRDRRGFVTGGTWCVDRNKIVEFWPTEDGGAEILRADKRGGGSGCNLAVDIEVARPRDAGGDDWPHRRLRAGCSLLAAADAAGIDRVQMQAVAGGATHYADCFISARSGRRTHIYQTGTNRPADARPFRPLADERPDHSPRPTRGPPTHGRPLAAGSQWVGQRAQEGAGGGPFDQPRTREHRSGAHRAADPRPCLPHLNFLIVNDHEIGAVAGERSVQGDATDIAACRRAAESVMAQGGMDLVVVHFPRGSIVARRGGSTTLHPAVAIPAEAVVSANGAGDAFAAGMLYGLHEGWPIDDCCACPRATAAASLRGLSTTETVAPWQDCLALARDWGWRDRPA